MSSDLPQWSEFEKHVVELQLHLEVMESLSDRPTIKPPIVPYSAPPSSSSSIYHEKLDKSRSEIRLLDVALTEDDSPIGCSLVTVSLDSNPKYAAVSYEWGDTKNTEEILVNGSPFQATKNLVAALRQFRKTARSITYGGPEEAVRLWVDALCTNQDDIPERSSQVQLMRPIYRKAELVLSWLGQKEETQLALKALRGIVKNIEVLQPHTGVVSIGIQWLVAMPTLCEKQYYVNVSDEKDTRVTGNYIWDVLTLFANHSYWLRTWIVQEIILGRKVVLMAGDEALDLDTLDDFTASLQNLLLESRECPSYVNPQTWAIISSNFHAWRPCRESTNMRWQHQRGKLGCMGLDMVLATRMHSATDPRDRVFGLLGLTHMGIVPDYSRSPESVFCEFATRWVSKGKNLEYLLIYAGRGVHAIQYLQLPSWVPDWQMLPKGLSNFNPSFYSAGGHPEVFRRLLPLTGPFVFSNILVMSGVVNSTVGPTSNVIGRGSEASEKHYKFAVDYLAGRKTPRYPTGVPHLQALFRVALADRDLLRNTRLSTTSQTFFTLALGYLRTIIETSSPKKSQSIYYTLTVRLPELGLANGEEFAASFSKKFLGGSSRYVDEWKSAEDAIVTHPSIMNALMAAMAVIHIENSDKRFFETSSGLLGLGPRGMLKDDLVCIFGGCNMPVILRSIESHHVFVGTCFVLGLMDGEALKPEALIEAGGIQYFGIR